MSQSPVKKSLKLHAASVEAVPARTSKIAEHVGILLLFHLRDLAVTKLQVCISRAWAQCARQSRLLPLSTKESAHTSDVALLTHMPAHTVTCQVVAPAYLARIATRQSPAACPWRTCWHRHPRSLSSHPCLRPPRSARSASTLAARPVCMTDPRGWASRACASTRRTSRAAQRRTSRAAHQPMCDLKWNLTCSTYFWRIWLVLYTMNSS